MAAVPVTAAIAQRAAVLGWRDLPEDLIERTKQCLLDWFAVTVPGAQEELTDILVREALEDGATGPASVPAHKLLELRLLPVSSAAVAGPPRGRRSGRESAEQGAVMSNFLFTSESVSEGHPDKVADQISDAVLDAILEQDPTGRVAAETLVSTGLVVMAGEITTKASVDYARVARDTIRAIGYNDPQLRFDADGTRGDREAAVAWLRTAPKSTVLQTVVGVKRNLTFVDWVWPGAGDGVAVLSWDQDGHVAHIMVQRRSRPAAARPPSAL